jgi:hypothetical protein
MLTRRKFFALVAGAAVAPKALLPKIPSLEDLQRAYEQVKFSQPDRTVFSPKFHYQFIQVEQSEGARKLLAQEHQKPQTLYWSKNLDPETWPNDLA